MHGPQRENHVIVHASASLGYPRELLPKLKGGLTHGETPFRHHWGTSRWRLMRPIASVGHSVIARGVILLMLVNPSVEKGNQSSNSSSVADPAEQLLWTTKDEDYDISAERADTSQVANQGTRFADCEP